MEHRLAASPVSSEAPGNAAFLPTRGRLARGGMHISGLSDPPIPPGTPPEPPDPDQPPPIEEPPPPIPIPPDDPPPPLIAVSPERGSDIHARGRGSWKNWLKGRGWTGY